MGNISPQTPSRISQLLDDVAFVCFCCLSTKAGYQPNIMAMQGVRNPTMGTSPATMGMKLATR